MVYVSRWIHRYAVSQMILACVSDMVGIWTLIGLETLVDAILTLLYKYRRTNLGYPCG